MIKYPVPCNFKNIWHKLQNINNNYCSRQLTLTPNYCTQKCENDPHKNYKFERKVCIITGK